MKHPGLPGLVCGLAVVPSLAQAKDYVNDPLTVANFPGRGGAKGGKFTNNGWVTVDEPDAVWYEIPDALPDCKIEYTVTGLSLATSLTGSDHDIFVLYQAPTGKAEPIAYSPGFRNNDFKAMTRIFGTQEQGRGGAMKLELAFCPRGDPWYHDEACDAKCEGSGIAYARGNQKDVGWDAAKTYKMVVAWGNGSISFSRDGEVLGTVKYPGVYAPQPLRVRLGSPRHDGVYPGQAFMPKGLTFKDVLISGTAGVRTPVCGAPPVALPDAGIVDAAVAQPDGGGAAVTHFALQDVTAASWEKGVFPDTKDLNIEADVNGIPTAIAYLKFPPIPNGATHAVLTLHTGVSGSSAGGSGQVCLVADDTWNEGTLTWAKRPPEGMLCAGPERGVDPDSEVAWDVTALLKTAAPGNRNLALISHDGNGAHYLSKEANPAKGPRLLVLPAPAPPLPSDAGVDASIELDAAAGADGPAMSPLDSAAQAAKDAAIAPGDAAGSDGGTTDLSSGCGCRVAGRTSARWPGLLAALLLVIARRRRRRE
ncbi:MAG: DNRLRE domain-containing protein [Myxococcales bacterium]|nr:DNRLRE domain-containing protein [Myxococcales bacterium]